jgi:K+-sensing histidine kinase KdpD
MPNGNKNHRLEPIVDTLIGASVAAVGATAASMVAIGQRWEASIPLVFTVVLLVVSGVFGARAGVLGTVIAALVFSVFLFRPLGRLQVGSDLARANLAWMLLLGVSFSFLFAPQNSAFRRR